MRIQLLWELHALFSEGVYTPLALIGPNKVACAPGVNCLIFMRMGIPKCPTSDQGGEFKNS